jgi:hypothetical protein
MRIGIRCLMSRRPTVQWRDDIKIQLTVIITEIDRSSSARWSGSFPALHFRLFDFYKIHFVVINDKKPECYEHSSSSSGGVQGILTHSKHLDIIGKTALKSGCNFGIPRFLHFVSPHQREVSAVCLFSAQVPASHG